MCRYCAGRVQPLGDSRSSDWLFDESPELGVFVTREVRAGEPIDIANHDHDGDWVFLTHDERRDADGYLVDEDVILLHVSHVVDAHPEVMHFADLPRGYFAERQPDGSWLRDELIAEGEH